VWWVMQGQTRAVQDWQWGGGHVAKHTGQGSGKGIMEIKVVNAIVVTSQQLQEEAFQTRTSHGGSCVCGEHICERHLRWHSNGDGKMHCLIIWI